MQQFADIATAEQSDGDQAQLLLVCGNKTATARLLNEDQMFARILRLHDDSGTSLWRTTRAGAVIDLGFDLTDVELPVNRRGVFFPPDAPGDLSRPKQFLPARDQMNAR